MPELRGEDGRGKERRMRFSIIIPAYNAEDRIHLILDSIKSQTFKDYELIVVCEPYADLTEAVANAYGANVYFMDGNCADRRNEGLDHAAGEYVLFCDDDDRWLHPYALEQIDRELTAMKDVPDMIQCSFVFGERGVTIVGNGKIWPNVWSKIWKRSAIGSTRFRTQDFPADDLGFTNRMLAKGISVDFLPLLWYEYNWMRPGSVTWDLAQNGKVGGR